MVRNETRLVAQGYTQEESIDYDETFTSIVRLEAIIILLVFAYYKDFKLYQIDIKSIFLNSIIKEEVYIEQPLGFEDHKFSNHVYKLNKYLYGLKQASRAWYERLRKFLIENSFKRGNMDTTLLLKKENKILLVVQVYMMISFFVLLNNHYVRNL